MDLLYYGFALLVFVAAALTIEAIYGWWFSTQSQAARRLSQRLDQVKRNRVVQSDGRVDGLYKQRKLARHSKADEVLRQVPGIHGIDNWLQQSGTDWSVGRLLMYAGLAFGLGFLRTLLLEFPQELLLAGRKLLGGLDRYLNVEIALIPRAQNGHAHAAQPELLARFD